MTSLFIVLGLLSPWLIWNSYLFFYVLTLDKSFNIILFSRKQLYKYLAYVFTLLAVSIYLFLIRFNNVGKMMNVNVLWEEFSKILKALSWLESFAFASFGLLWLIFWIMLTRVVLHYFNQCILTLYIYYFQYNFFRKISYWLVDVSCDYTFYLIRRVKIFTKNVNIRGNSMLLWPIGINWILSRLYVVILPYLIIFDMIVQDGLISKFFIILPWFYLYSLFKGFWYIFEKVSTAENHDLTEEAYGIR